MAFLILGKSEDATTKDNYMGTYRTSPNYINSVNSEHKINKLWRWYLDKEMGDGLSESDLVQAHELIYEYKTLGKNFNIIELAEHKNLLTKGKFIGYDLSFKNYQSMLSWGLEILPSGPKDDSRFPVLFKLTEKYFQPKLNEYGLINEYENIIFLFQTLLALHNITPNAFETYLSEFQILAIGLLVA